MESVVDQVLDVVTGYVSLPKLVALVILAVIVCCCCGGLPSYGIYKVVIASKMGEADGCCPPEPGTFVSLARANILFSLARVGVSVLFFLDMDSIYLDIASYAANFGPILFMGLILYIDRNRICTPLCSSTSQFYYTLFILYLGLFVLGGFKGLYFLRLVHGAVGLIFSLFVIRQAHAERASHGLDDDVETGHHATDHQDHAELASELSTNLDTSSVHEKVSEQLAGFPKGTQE